MYDIFNAKSPVNPIPVSRPAAQASSASSWPADSITYVCVTTPNLDRLKRNIPVVLPYVDRAVFIVGREDKATFDYLDSLGEKVQWVYHPWQDSFAKQYNQYLKLIRGGWILLCDDDELPSEGMLRVLRETVQYSEGGTKFGVVEFRSNDISYVKGKWAERHDNGPCEYYRQVFFKWYPDMFYSIDLHQALQGMRGPVARRTEHYYHIKSTEDEYRNACRNYFISGAWGPGARTEGDKTEDWHTLKQLLQIHHPEVKIFADLNTLMVDGTVHSEIKDWMRKYRDFQKGIDGEYYGELRAYWKYYFEILHPEQA